MQMVPFVGKIKSSERFRAKWPTETRRSVRVSTLEGKAKRHWSGIFGGYDVELQFRSIYGPLQRPRIDTCEVAHETASYKGLIGSFGAGPESLSYVEAEAELNILADSSG